MTDVRQHLLLPQILNELSPTACGMSVVVRPDRDAETGYTLSFGRGQPVAAAAAAAAPDGMALPTVLEHAAAGVGVGGAGSGVVQLCIVRDGDAARMGGCEELARLTLQVTERCPPLCPPLFCWCILQCLVR